MYMYTVHIHDIVIHLPFPLPFPPTSSLQKSVDAYDGDFGNIRVRQSTNYCFLYFEHYSLSPPLWVQGSSSALRLSSEVLNTLGLGLGDTANQLEKDVSFSLSLSHTHTHARTHTHTHTYTHTHTQPVNILFFTKMTQLRLMLYLYCMWSIYIIHPFMIVMM